MHPAQMMNRHDGRCSALAVVQPRRWPALAVLLSLIVATVTGMGGTAEPAGATDWCGLNGVIRLSFAPDSVQTTAQVDPDPEGMTVVDLHALLTDVEPVQRDGEAFLAIGAFELTLEIEGADGHVTEQTFPWRVLSVGRSAGECVVGIAQSGRLNSGGPTLLVNWKLMFPGPVEDVVFRLDPAGVPSCVTTEGCAESGAQAIYVGSLPSGQVKDMFGTGQAPAFLNPTQEPEVEVVAGEPTWRDFGIYEPRSE
ncbi:MAG: hypothetical protein R6X25_05475 [Candidatus Krumholzibacteriia bacterium]